MEIKGHSHTKMNCFLLLRSIAIGNHDAISSNCDLHGQTWYSQIIVSSFQEEAVTVPRHLFLYTYQWKKINHTGLFCCTPVHHSYIQEVCLPSSTLSSTLETILRKSAEKKIIMVFLLPLLHLKDYLFLSEMNFWAEWTNYVLSTHSVMKYRWCKHVKGSLLASESW